MSNVNQNPPTMPVQTNITSQDMQRIVRIGLQYLSSFLMTHGMITAASWIEPATGLIIGSISIIWTYYGNTINTKMKDILSKVPGTLIVTDHSLAYELPKEVMSNQEVKIVSMETRGTSIK